MGKQKILALNGSPRGRNSNTDRLLQPFLAGAVEAGAEAETLYVTDLNIKDCLGCFCCWKKTPGKCVLQDDMEPLLEKIKQADIVVWATPLYHFGMTARLKRILERTLPLVKPYIVRYGSQYGHPPRYAGNAKSVLLANCGFPERHHFDSLVAQMRQLSEGGTGLLGSILCPAGEVLAHIDVNWYLQAMKAAGKEIASFGQIAPETAAVLEKPIIPLDIFLEHANASWHITGDEAPTLEEAMQDHAKMGSDK